jgi:hypothetical protein
MDYSIYEDMPRTDWGMRAVFVLPPVLLLVLAAFRFTLDSGGAVYSLYGAFALAAAMAMLFFFFMPSKYLVLNSKIRIEFRSPIKFDIPFDSVVTLRKPRWSTVGINLPTNMSKANLLEIARKGRMTVTISPSDRQAFMDAYDKAYQEWSKNQKTNDKTN